MKKFAAELAAFLQRFYPEAELDGSYRFSADIRIHKGQVDVEIPVLTRLPDENSRPLRWQKSQSVPFGMRRQKDDAD